MMLISTVKALITFFMQCVATLNFFYIKWKGVHLLTIACAVV